MATLKQIEASRRNGAKSKGPVTPEGKARVARNGIRHGLYAQTVVLHNEDETLYSQWRENHLAEWEPATDTEYNLVIDIVDARWLLRRLRILQASAIDFEVERLRPEMDEAFEQMDEGTRTMFGFNSLITMNRSYQVIETSIRTQHRIIDRAIAQLLRLGRVRRNADRDACDEAPEPIPAAPAQLPEPENEAEFEEQTREQVPAIWKTPQKPQSKPQPNCFIGPPASAEDRERVLALLRAQQLTRRPAA